MTSTNSTKPSAKPTAESLDAQYERVAAEAAQIAAEKTRLAQEEADRLYSHQTLTDEETVTSYSAKPYEDAVHQAREALHRAMVATPVAKALTDFYVAQSRRRAAFDEYISALARQGRDVAGAQHPQLEPVDLIALMQRTAEKAGTDARLQAEAAWSD